jgi:hypothetical protein
MSDKKQVNIIIPVYKENITNEETFSLRQCVKVLSAHQITLICPKALKLDVYYKEYPNFKVEYFKASYFKNIQGYNKLMLSNELYQRFRQFKYLLIYQLDAWVFRDELDYWCLQGFDYIGAPWFSGWDNVDFNAKCIGIGNGGFSLRNVKSHLKFASHPFLWINRKKMFLNLYKGGFIDVLKILPRLLKRLYDNNLQIAKNKLKSNEDGYWSLNVGGNFRTFKIPDGTEAARFSFEMNPEKLYEITGHKLPFGCHAWEKNMKFWKKFILIDQD